MSKRQDIVTAVIAAMGSISVANGYNTDVNKVFEWLDRPLKEDWTELPAIVVMDTDDEVGTEETEGNEASDLAEHKLYFEIYGFVSNADTTPAAARNLAEDIIEAFSGLDVKALGIFGGSFLGNEMYTGIEKKRVGVCINRFFLRYLTRAWEY